MFVVCQMSFDDTDHNINDMVLVILKPRSLTAAAPQFALEACVVANTGYISNTL